MSNTELCKFYMGFQQNNTKMPEATCANVIATLDKHFNGIWTWELADERFAMDNTTVCTTVTLYTPGRIYTGRSLCKIKDYSTNHLSAILDACQTFMNKQNLQSQQPQQLQSAGQQMTPDQIMNAIEQQTLQNTNTSIPSQSVNKPDMSIIDTEYYLMNNNQQNSTFSQSSNNLQSNVDYDAPQDRYKGFSQRQIDRLNQFKKDFDILNDDIFGNYVNTWDKTLMSKQDITPANVEGFLAWAENLGKMGC